MKLETIKKLVAVTSLVTMMPFVAFADTTLESISPDPGALSVADAADVVLTLTATGLNPTVSIADQAISVAAPGVDDITVDDTRGTQVGWTLSVTSTNITKQLADLDVVGNAIAGDLVAFTGTFNCVNTHATNAASRYRVEVTTGGLPNGATGKFKWLSPADVETLNVFALAAGNLLDSGITIDWADATVLTVGDVMVKRVSCVKYTSITETPATLTSLSGSTSGLSLGAAALFAGAGATSGANSVMIAEGGSGNGSFKADLGLAGTLRKNSETGAHGTGGSGVGTLTFSVA